MSTTMMTAIGGSRSTLPYDGCTKQKIVAVVGDSRVGKSCLLQAFKNSKYSDECEDQLVNVSVRGHKMALAVWDTLGADYCGNMRIMAYTSVKCFVLCFDVSNETSYENVMVKWVPEIRHFCPAVPIVLVGTKTDLRQSPNLKCLPRRAGMKLKESVAALAYVECSAKDMSNLKSIFNAVARSLQRSELDCSYCCCTIM